MPEWLTASFTQPMVDWRVLSLGLVYRTLLPPDAAPQALIRDLANVAGVQSVNLRHTRTEA